MATRFDYWLESLQCALDAAGVTVTPEQEMQIAKAIEISDENRSMFFAPVENPLSSENSRLKARLKAAEQERERVENVWREAMAVGTGVEKKWLVRRGQQIHVERF